MATNKPKAVDAGADPGLGYLDNPNLDLIAHGALYAGPEGPTSERGNITNNLQRINTVVYVNNSMHAGGANNEVQLNLDGIISGDNELRYDATTNILSTGGLILTGNLQVYGSSNLGSPSGLKITGGSDGQFLKTDGNGNIAWANVSDYQATANWTAVSGPTRILNKPTLATVATSGAYNDLQGIPSFAAVATTGQYTSLSGRPTIPGNTSQLINDSGFITSTGIPTQTGNGGKFLTTDGSTISWATIPTVITSYNDLTNKPTLFSGSYADLTNKPTLFDGAYSSLTGTPTIPSDISDLTDTTNLLGGATNEITNTDGINTYSVSVATTGVISMNTGRGGIEFGAMPEVGGPTHLHVMRVAGQNGSTDLYFGDDYNYVKLPGLYGDGSQGVEIGSSYNEGTVHTWKFGTNGDLIVPNDVLAQEGNNLNFKVFNPISGGTTISLQNRDVDTGSKTTQLEVTPTFISLVTDFAGAQHTWAFDTDGILYTPGGLDVTGDINGNVSPFMVRNIGVTQLQAEDGTGNSAFFTATADKDFPEYKATITLDTISDGTKEWTFDNGGSLTVPGPIMGNGLNLYGESTAESYAFITIPNNTNSATTPIHIGNDNGNVDISTINQGTSATYHWTYDNTGNLTLPGNTFAVNYANGTQVSLGGGSGAVSSVNTKTGDVVLSTTDINEGTNLYFTDTRANTAFDNRLAVKSTTNLTEGTNLYYTTARANAAMAAFTGDLTAGNASITNNVSAKTANITGTSVTGVNAILAGPTFTPLSNTMAGFVSNVNSYTQLTIQNKSTGADATTDFIATADNGSDTVNYLDMGIINSGYDALTPTNSLGNIVYAADSYIYAQGNTSAVSQSGGNLAIGTTVAGKTVKIFAGGVTASNIVATVANTGVTVVGNVTATKFVGDGSSLTNITVNASGNIVGTTPNVSLVAGSFTATFDNTGVLTLPTNGGDEGGELRLGVPATNTTLTSRVTVDVYQDRFRIFDGSTKGVYVDLSQAATGVSTLLNNRVGATNLALDTSLTFDNLKIQIKSQGSGVWIFAGTVSGTATYQYSITYQLSATSATGTVGNMSATTTVAAIGTTGWWFGTAASTATTIITDTTNNKMYRVTWMTTTGSSPYGNYVSIERLI